MKKRSLPFRVLAALLLGIAAGLLCACFPGGGNFTAQFIKPFGDIFVNLLKFLVVPVVLFSMLGGILSMEDVRQVGRVGLRAFVYFFLTTAIACIIGLFAATCFRLLGLFPILQAQNQSYAPEQFGGIMQTLTDMFPSNLWRSLAEGNMLQIILIALGFGFAILAAGESGMLCRRIVSSFYSVLEQLMAYIIWLSPFGVFAYMAWIVATQGAQILGSLALVLLCAYLAYGLHGLLVYGAAAGFFGKTSPGRFFRAVFPAMVFAFTSASSAASLPVSKQCAHTLGVDDNISSFVLPLGATINMDGTAIYQCVATVFLATCAGMELSLGQMALVVATATLSSVGTAGVSGAGTIMLAMVLETVGIPVSYIGLIVAMDRLFDMGRTCLNVAGDLSCALCVSRWEAKK